MIDILHSTSLAMQCRGSCYYLPIHVSSSGYNLVRPCCDFEMNSTETTCTVTINALPSSMVGDESVLVLELVPARCNFVSNMNQLLVFVEHLRAGVCTRQ